MRNLTYGEEVVRLHDFFADWFADRGDRRFADFAEAMAPDFYLVSTDGEFMSRDQIVGFVEGAKGTGHVDIAIVDPVIRSDAHVLLGTYEEHQVKRGVRSARMSTAVLTRSAEAPGGWLWHAVHETWIDPPGGFA